MGSLLGINNDSSTSPYASALSAQQGVDQYLTLLEHKAAIYQNQQNLAKALQDQMNGVGPNPAQTQYQANTQNNIANAQGLIASQRGLNPALAVRMGANQAALENQRASLGSALLQQQQQLGATQNLGNLYGQMQSGNVAHLNRSDNYAQGANQMNANVAAGNAAQNTALVGGLINAGGAIGAGAAGGGKAHGGMIGGQPNVPGDSTQNDTVHVMLSPGEIVVPRSMAHDPEKAKLFIDHLIGGGGDYADVLKARRKRKAA